MLEQASCRFRTGLATAIALAVGATANADASDGAPLPEQRSRDILARIDGAPEEIGWIARHVALDYKTGFRVSRSLSYGKYRFDLRLRGPVFKTPVRRKNYGLKIELKF